MIGAAARSLVGPHASVPQRRRGGAGQRSNGAYWVRGGGVSLGLLAFAVSSPELNAPSLDVAARFLLQWRALVGLLDTAACRKVPLSCS